ncbi:MAG: glycosyltransferase family 2 protein [Candidatus Paceibacterota bacterium]
MIPTYLKLSKAADLTDKKDRFIYRFFEILPGLLAWLTLALIIILSFLQPVFMAIFIIIFDVYWLIKTIYLSAHMRAAFKKMRANMNINWLDKLKQLPSDSFSLKKIKSWEDIYHIIILPTYKEGVDIIRPSIDSLLNSDYPKDKMIVVLAQEERAGELADEIAKQVQGEYGKSFFKLIMVKHPADIPGELAGKGSNAAFAIKYVKENTVDQLGLDYDRVLVSNFDIDTVVPQHYFSLLTYTFLTTANPTRAGYQPIPIYINNIWEAPSFARVFSFSTTFWQMIQQSRAEQLVTFSSQSIGLRALVDVDFWQANMVSEDSRIFWQCLLRYDGNWQTVPMHYPVYMDANVAPTFWQTFKNQYKQIRRWHYGVENNPYFMFGFLKNKAISWKKKLHFSFALTEKTHSASTNALIIFLLGWLPVMVGGTAFNQTVLSYNLPFITRSIMTLAMLGLISSAIISVILLPPRPPNYGKLKWAWMFLQWLLFPVNFIFFGAIPALDAQTRLMFGRYMGFWVTPKTRRRASTQNAKDAAFQPGELKAGENS